ncbi:outer membrane protein TolC [Dyadobacter jejuensis]|uniref:Outer membrane protein TolC n=1 Tax=Dyadobacter jejuensis TaxID=1082580 RepID=A0A316ABV9_9BACT|nr:TolC family protein [Dyadobacter jejuensis]PWJ54748.1 outer membrane protein TolC [Dyadobacter jejuensis]
MKNERNLYSRLMAIVIVLFAVQSQAQDAGFSVHEAIDYAINHNLNIKSAKLDAVSAEAKIGEVRAAGLPQVAANVNLTDNLIIQRFFLPANFADPNAAADAPPVALKFGVKYSGAASATWNQLLFNGTYLVGLKAAATYRELAQKQVKQSRVTVAEAVSKAYYSAQVAEERAKVLDLNISRIDSLMAETKAMNESGFVELLDVNRLEVQLNNLRTERQNVQNLIELSYTLLKYQMGMPLDEPIRLKDSIKQENVAAIKAELVQPQVDYNNRIEYSLMDTQRKLADLDLRSIRSGYLPVLSASIGYGHNNGRDSMSDLFTSKWFNNSVLSLNLQIPIFDGLSKKYQIDQKKLALDKVKVNQTLLEQSIDLESAQAAINIKNAVGSLESQERNLALSREVARVSKIKYQEGVGSNIEVINAESSLKESETNYFAALYDLIIARIDLQKSKGELYTGKEN